jgi:hypothetical protein
VFPFRAGDEQAGRFRFVALRFIDRGDEGASLALDLPPLAERRQHMHVGHKVVDE